VNEAVRAFREQFRANARLLVQDLDAATDRVRLVALAEEDYARASFLDQRVLTPDRPAQWVPRGELTEVAGTLTATCGFIFHIGHVGSTLVSRLLGELPELLSVREPSLLRALAQLQRLRGRPESPWPPEALEPAVAAALGWLSRGFRPGQRAVVKATSFASELGPLLLAGGRDALFLYTAPETYILTILGGEASLQETQALAGERLLRLHARIGAEPWRLWELSLGERVALSWACEMTSLGAAGGEALWLDFEDLLAAPAPGLVRVAARFGIALSAETAEALVAGPIMRTYSKAPEHGYSPELRREVLADARARHGEELRRGLAFLDAAARDHGPVAAALERAERKDRECSG
jgi:hypothetical protein